MKRISIVLADDDEDDRLFFVEAITQLNLDSNIKLVNDGNELMKYLKDQDSPLPDLIFLDLNMPAKNGIECLSEIRTDKQLNKLSVAIYSTSAAEVDIEECFVRGANVYINKPNNFESLKTVLSRVITTNFQYSNSGLNKDNFVMMV
ncbi:response regulator [Aquiflexum sp. TKW24L]|uniref:response regulator n=1 Tax=Aquiflexum sp. TKW24L TaxID=2942212 RepID=UPI0020C0ADDD|nr:response regulator [Aquiflexum sp. TKW24L]MCL6261566.1 response regulator [Aquiflexum sp. TKW24L]